MWYLFVAAIVSAAPFHDILTTDNMDPSAREAAREVLACAVLSRDIPVREYAGSADLMDTLFDHPVLTADIVRGMGLGDFHVAENGARSYRVREGRSIEADFSEIYRVRGVRLYRISGQYYGSFFVHLSGKALLCARYQDMRDERVRVEVHASLCVDNRFYGFLVYLFPGLFKRLVDGQFSGYMDIAGRLSEALAADPERVYNRLLDQGVMDAREREQFTELFIMSRRRAR
ncbi:MAG: hypothetical protein NTZ78_02755 [Candidatus Aureabacteria bacterium]|nr:hypothetical protein [Candidatus Auribacterota bacterium]